MAWPREVGTFVPGHEGKFLVGYPLSFLRKGVHSSKQTKENRQMTGNAGGARAVQHQSLWFFSCILYYIEYINKERYIGLFIESSCPLLSRSPFCTNFLIQPVCLYYYLLRVQKSILSNKHTKNPGFAEIS